jgi:hypothetical protein
MRFWILGSRFRGIVTASGLAACHIRGVSRGLVHPSSSFATDAVVFEQEHSRTWQRCSESLDEGEMPLSSVLDSPACPPVVRQAGRCRNPVGPQWRIECALGSAVAETRGIGGGRP